MSGNSPHPIRKICCRCNKDVAGQPREKDHEGNYWCKPCADGDRLHKLHVNSGICEGCGEAVGTARLLSLGGEALCPNCRERRFKFGMKPRNVSASSGSSWLGSLKSMLGR